MTTTSAGRRLTPSARAVGCFFLWTGGIHVGIVAAGPDLYRHFADAALVPGLTDAWRTVFMPHPALAGLVVAAGEALLGFLLLAGSPTRRRIGWVGVIGFHVALMCFGWGFWLWCVPALVLLVRAARQDWSNADGHRSSRAVTLVDHTR
jgi:hypothetical protein